MNGLRDSRMPRFLPLALAVKKKLRVPAWAFPTENCMFRSTQKQSFKDLSMEVETVIGRLLFLLFEALFLFLEALQLLHFGLQKKHWSLMYCVLAI